MAATDLDTPHAATALTRFFFLPTYAPQGTWSVINWWESRRVVYNLCVGATGVVSTAVAIAFSMLPPHHRAFAPEIPVLPILVYGLLANACYTLGPVADIIIRKRWGEAYAAVGPALFRYGFAFSIGLTLLPIPVSMLGWALRLLGVLD